MTTTTVPVDRHHISPRAVLLIVLALMVAAGIALAIAVVQSDSDEVRPSAVPAAVGGGAAAVSADAAERWAESESAVVVASADAAERWAVGAPPERQASADAAERWASS